MPFKTPSLHTKLYAAIQNSTIPAI